MYTTTEQQDAQTACTGRSVHARYVATPSRIHIYYYATVRS